MNHAREIIENTIAVKSKNKVLRIIRNEIMHKPEATENEIFKYLKHNPTEQWLKVLSRLTKKDLFLQLSSVVDFFDLKTFKYMIEKKLLNEEYISDLRYINQHSHALSKNALELFNHFEKEGYYNLNHENGEVFLNNCIKKFEVAFLMDGLNDFESARNKMEKSINTDHKLWMYLNKYDDLSLLDSRENSNENTVIERLINLKKFKFADEETIELLCPPEKNELADLSYEYQVKLFEQLTEKAKNLAIDLNEDVEILYKFIKSKEEKEKISQHIKYSEKSNKNKKRL